MNGRRTAIILGAGASFCYEDGNGPLPLQKDIVGRLGGISVASGEAPNFIGPSGLTYSPELAKLLKARYAIRDDASANINRLFFWDQLRERGETLETVYADIDRSLPKKDRWVLEDFAAILRTSVKQPIPQRDVTHVCRHYRRLAKMIEPGDYIVSFNWDSLMADALLYFCPFWYPRSGFGPFQLDAITGVRTKSFAIQSLVHLYHIHGSVLLFELLKEGPDSDGTGHLLYLGPPGYTEINSFMSIIDASKESPEPRRTASDLDKWAVSRGYLHINDCWFRPLFVPPSFEKGDYSHPYHSALRRRLHTLLPMTEVYVIIGYSFPPADFHHLSAFFVPDVMRPQSEVITVDRSSLDADFQNRVTRIFPNMRNYDFTNTDFKIFGIEPDENIARFYA